MILRCMLWISYKMSVFNFKKFHKVIRKKFNKNFQLPKNVIACFNDLFFSYIASRNIINPQIINIFKTLFNNAINKINNRANMNSAQYIKIEIQNNMKILIANYLELVSIEALDFVNLNIIKGNDEIIFINSIQDLFTNATLLCSSPKLVPTLNELIGSHN